MVCQFKLCRKCRGATMWNLIGPNAICSACGRRERIEPWLARVDAFVLVGFLVIIFCWLVFLVGRASGQEYTFPQLDVVERLRAEGRLDRDYPKFPVEKKNETDKEQMRRWMMRYCWSIPDPCYAPSSQEFPP